MDNHNRHGSGRFLCWNVGGGINSQHKLTAIRSKIIETCCDIICLLETKKEMFDLSFIKKFCPPSFDCFKFAPSHGASGGTIIIWKGNRFSGQIIAQNDFVMSVEFVSTHSGAIWVLTNIYAPCTSERKVEFLNWLHDFEMPKETEWLLVGDINLIRQPSDRNRPGGNVQEMLRFNDDISYLRLQLLHLQGHKFT
jgi:exonuclease III